MVTVVKKGASQEEINKLFQRLTKESSIKKGFDAYKFCGKVKFNEDGVHIQKQMRDEWE